MIHVGQFVCAIGFSQILPMVPLWFEYMHTQDVTMDSFILCASVYAFATGVSSKNLIILAAGIIIGLIIAGMYKGKAMAGASALPFYNSGITYCVLIIFIAHFIERWQRHISGKEPFISLEVRS